MQCLFTTRQEVIARYLAPDVKQNCTYAHRIETNKFIFSFFLSLATVKEKRLELTYLHVVHNHICQTRPFCLSCMLLQSPLYPNAVTIFSFRQSLRYSRKVPIFMKTKEFFIVFITVLYRPLF